MKTLFTVALLSFQCTSTLAKACAAGSCPANQDGTSLMQVKTVVQRGLETAPSVLDRVRIGPRPMEHRDHPKAPQESSSKVFKKAEGKAVGIEWHAKHREFYTGFVSVKMPNPQKGRQAKLFVTYVPQANADQNGGGPVLIWLNGGPGCSSLFGFFGGIGPLFLDRCPSSSRRSWCLDNQQCKGRGINGINGDGEQCLPDKVVENEFSWHHHASLIFIETPPPVGFDRSQDVSGQISHQDWTSDDASKKGAMSQSYLGEFHAGAVKSVIDTLESEGTLGAPFSSIFLGGESFAGIYVGHMMPQLMDSHGIAARFGGILILNPKLSEYDRVDTALQAFVNRGFMKKEALEKVESVCNNTCPDQPLSKCVDLSTVGKQDEETDCTRAYYAAYESHSSRVTASDASKRGGWNWYNSRYKCELCPTRSTLDGGPNCAPKCFDVGGYNKLLNNRQVQRVLNVAEGGAKGPDFPWEILTDHKTMKPWISIKAMEDRPSFMQDPHTIQNISVLNNMRNRDRSVGPFRFWVLSGDSDLESLHETSMHSMEAMFGKPQTATAWRDNSGSIVGDFMSYERYDHSRLIRLDGGGHLPTYFATKASAEVFKMFVKNEPPSSTHKEDVIEDPCRHALCCFVPPVVDTHLGDRPKQGDPCWPKQTEER